MVSTLIATPNSKNETYPLSFMEHVFAGVPAYQTLTAQIAFHSDGNLLMPDLYLKIKRAVHYVYWKLYPELRAVLVRRNGQWMFTQYKHLGDCNEIIRVGTAKINSVFTIDNLLNDLSNERFPFDLPMWRVVLAFDEPNRVHLVVSAAHILMDGQSMFKVLSAILEKIQDQSLGPITDLQVEKALMERWNFRPLPSQVLKKVPFKSLKEYLNGMIGLVIRMVFGIIVFASYRKPPNPIGKAHSQHKSLFSRAIQPSIVKRLLQVAKASNVTLTTLLHVAIVQAHYIAFPRRNKERLTFNTAINLRRFCEKYPGDIGNYIIPSPYATIENVEEARDTNAILEKIHRIVTPASLQGAIGFAIMCEEYKMHRFVSAKTIAFNDFVTSNVGELGQFIPEKTKVGSMELIPEIAHFTTNPMFPVINCVTLHDKLTFTLNYIDLFMSDLEAKAFLNAMVDQLTAMAQREV